MRRLFFKSFLCDFLVMSMIFSISANALTVYSPNSERTYDTHTYWETTTGFEAVYAKPLYELNTVLDYTDMGVDAFSVLTDVAVGKDNSVYILDSGNSRIVKLSPNYTTDREFIDFGGESFNGAQGIFISDEQLIYIADTENARVLVGNLQGSLVNVLKLPESELIPDDFVYRPIKIAVDTEGYTYVLSDGSYYGAILYSPNGEFLGFFGANTVNSGLFDILASIWEKLTMTNEKRSKQASKLPYQFTDLYIDSHDFLYTATGKTEKSGLQKGVIKKMSPSGINILDSENVVFGEKFISSSGNADFEIETQNMEGITIDEDGFIYTYDTSYGKIYIYDQECNMLSAFGGGLSYGLQDGTFRQISGIDVSENDIFVTDGVKNTLTIFSCTDYGAAVKHLQQLTLEGDYQLAKAGWEQILAYDQNSQFAYRGLAKAYLVEKDYKNAMKYAKIAYDRDTYSLAFQQVRKTFLHEHFKIIVIITAFLIGLIIALKKLIIHKNIKIIKDYHVKLFLKTTFHPATVFSEVKQKKLLSVKCAVISLFLFYLSAAMQTMFGSFVFVDSSVSSFNSVLLFLKTFGFVLLWTISNWAVCSLFGGIGKIKEIFVVITYSLFPVTVWNFLYIILTYILVPSESSFLSVIHIAVIIYAVIMVIIGSIIIHDFSFGKFIGTTVLSFIGMAIVIFVGIIIVILVQQLVAFFATVYNEMFYR